MRIPQDRFAEMRARVAKRKEAELNRRMRTKEKAVVKKFAQANDFRGRIRFMPDDRLQDATMATEFPNFMAELSDMYQKHKRVPRRKLV